MGALRDCSVRSEPSVSAINQWFRFHLTMDGTNIYGGQDEILTIDCQTNGFAHFNSIMHPCATNSQFSHNTILNALCVCRNSTVWMKPNPLPKRMADKHITIVLRRVNYLSGCCNAFAFSNKLGELASQLVCICFLWICIFVSTGLCLYFVTDVFVGSLFEHYPPTSHDLEPTHTFNPHYVRDRALMIFFVVVGRRIW